MSLTTETIWISIGLLGQFLFSMRFIIQWIASEKKRQSVIPEMFWFFSISGGLVLLSYAIWRKDPLFILGQAFGVFIYARNIYFISKRRENPAG
ncbi:MAG: lipid-A-disaccharide synthase N-terminal domain-containing protein [Deltaproteobacteria bacterium]|jgi:lipid-A-disaccharide synthase-like uncharacterized protein|nr:lipid-A-disaccharide synthase N-terminal domain-containing protein [Deltaproteobacteria bacterium]